MNVNEYEDEGRKKLKTVFPKVNWEFTSNPMAVFDAYGHVDGKVITAEIKCRQHNIEQYNDCFLEIKKYAELTNTVQANEQIIYVAHYTDGKTATWNITPALNKKYEVVNIKMNKSTANDTAGGKKYKPCIVLPLADADIRFTDSGKKIK